MSFKTYLEAEISPEDLKQIGILKRRMAWLKTTGDDSGVKQDVADTQREIKRIQNRYKSDEDRAKEKQKADAASLRGYKQRGDVRREKEKGAIGIYAALSDEEKAIEAIVKINRTSWMEKSERESIINDIIKAFDIKQRPYSLRSKLSLKDKNALKGVADGTKTRAMPEKLIEIAKKHRKGSGYFVG